MTGERKILLINRPVQIRFAVTVVIFNIMAGIIFAGALALFLKSSIRGGFVNLDTIEKSIMPLTGIIGGIYILISSLAIWIIMVRTTHRFVGPLYRISESVREMTEGNLMPPPSLRKGDDLMENFESLGSLRDRLIWEVVELKRSVRTIREKGTESGEGKKALEVIQKIIDGYEIPPVD